MLSFTAIDLLLFKKYTLGCLLISALIILVSCEEATLLNETKGNLGPRAKLSASPGMSYLGYVPLDIGTQSNPSAEYVLKYIDTGESMLLSKIDFFANYYSPSTSFASSEQHLATVPASEFFPDPESDSLKANLSIPLDTIATTFGIDRQDVAAGDVSSLRWKMYLTTGDTIALKCPYSGLDDYFECPAPEYKPMPTIRVVHGLYPDEFTGHYRFKQNETGPLDMWLFSETFEAKLSIDPNNELTGRVFKAEPYADNIGDLDSLSIALSFNRFGPLLNYSSTGYQCGENGEEIELGPHYLPEHEFNPDEDSSFTLLINENQTFNCGKPGGIVSLTATRID